MTHPKRQVEDGPATAHAAAEFANRIAISAARTLEEAVTTASVLVGNAAIAQGSSADQEAMVAVAFDAMDHARSAASFALMIRIEANRSEDADAIGNEVEAIASYERARRLHGFLDGAVALVKRAGRPNALINALAQAVCASEARREA